MSSFYSHGSCQGKLGPFTSICVLSYTDNIQSNPRFWFYSTSNMTGAFDLPLLTHCLSNVWVNHSFVCLAMPLMHTESSSINYFAWPNKDVVRLRLCEENQHNQHKMQLYTIPSYTHLSPMYPQQRPERIASITVTLCRTRPLLHSNNITSVRITTEASTPVRHGGWKSVFVHRGGGSVFCHTCLRHTHSSGGEITRTEKGKTLGAPAAQKRENPAGSMEANYRGGLTDWRWVGGGRCATLITERRR